MTPGHAPLRVRDSHPLRSDFPDGSARSTCSYTAILQLRPCIATPAVWALPRSLATTGGIISLFSLPQGTKMFQFPWFASLQRRSDSRPSGGWVVPFGNPGVTGHLHLARAYRSLSRPSSPPRAKASTRRPNLLSPHGGCTRRNAMPPALMLYSIICSL